VAVTWAGPEVPEGQVGVLLEKDQAIGIFVVDPPGKKQTTVEILDAWTQGVVARNRALKLLELRKPSPESEKVSLLVWAPEVGAPLFVDGVKTGSLPAWILLSRESHELTTELSTGERPGAKIESAEPGEYVLYLAGRQRPAGPDWSPAFLLEQDYFEREGEKALNRQQWIDVLGGSRIYFGFPPVKHPVLTHKVMPVYPASILRSHAHGTVAIEAIVDTEGYIKDPRVIASTDEEFSRAAIGAVEQWSYTPATLEGKPVRAIFTVHVEFGFR
jgi:TonB family protein